jgi:hypothetical protein
VEAQGKNAQYVLVFNMGGSMRIYRRVWARDDATAFRIELGCQKMQARVQGLEDKDGYTVGLDMDMTGGFGNGDIPQALVAWGPFHDFMTSQFFHQEESSFRVHNMSGKMDLRDFISSTTVKTKDIFRPEYMACLDVYVNCFGRMSNLYHLSGNLQHQDGMPSVHFRGFRSTKEVVATLQSSLLEELCSEPSITVNMIGANCHIGRYVDTSEMGIVQRLFKKKWPDRIRFMCRTEQHYNVIIFSVQDMPGMFPDLPRRWVDNCSTFNCTLTRRGILCVRVSFKSRLRWTLECEENAFLAMERVKACVKECV